MTDPTALSIRLYRCIARAFPGEFRARHGRDLLATSEDLIQDVARQKGLVGLVPLMVRLLWDLFVGIVSEHAGDVGRDTKHALRVLKASPGFTVTAVLTLAIGLGANIAIFSLVHALLVRSLPVAQPEELYRLGDTNNCCFDSGLQGRYSLFSFPLFEHLREATRDEFVALAAFQADMPPIAVRRDGGVAASLKGQYVSANYFQMFGVRAAAGRLLVPEDDRPDAAPVVVISHRVWTDRFGQDPTLIGSSVRVDGQLMTVAGVAAPGFFGDTLRPDPPGLWIPLGQVPVFHGEGSLIEDASTDWLYAIGRLRAGVPVEQTSARATTALRRFLDAELSLSEEERAEIPEQQIRVVPAGRGVPRLEAQFGQPLTILFIASGLVLLLVAANLANLLLARADRGQVAIRAALGASTGRLMRQSLTEGLLLALAGGAIAVGLGTLSVRVLIALAFPAASYVPVDAAPTATVWLFALGLVVLTGVLFSAGPAWAMSRTPPLEALSGVGRSRHLRSFVPRRSLVVAQVALSFVLLTSAGLLAKSLGNLEGQELGFEPEERTIVQINPPPRDWEGREHLVRFYNEMRDRLLRIPSVREASYAIYSPMEGNNYGSDISIAGRAADPASPDGSSYNHVGPRYFETVGTRLLRGRLFEESEIRGGSAGVAIINDAFRRRFLEDDDPIGQRLGLGGPERAQDFAIVGVVEDVRYTGSNYWPGFAREPVLPMIFLPADGSILLGDLVVHASVESATLESEIRRALADVDPDIQVLRIWPHAAQVSANFRIERLMARLTSMYGLVALALASLGLYGVTAFGVAQRTREIGIRMALGADRQSIVRTFVRGPIAQTLVGLLIGVPLAVAATRLIAAQLYGVGSEDPVVLGTTILVLVTAAVVAASIPAFRAGSTDPTEALRNE